MNHQHTVLKTLNAAAMVAALSVGSIAGAETVNTRIGKLSFENGYPSKESVTKLYDENTNKVKTAEKLEL